MILFHLLDKGNSVAAAAAIGDDKLRGRASTASAFFPGESQMIQSHLIGNDARLCPDRLMGFDDQSR